MEKNRRLARYGGMEGTVGDNSSRPGLARVGAPFAVPGIGGGHHRSRSLRTTGHSAKLVRAWPVRPYAESNEEEKVK